ncbi:hypothetical protein L1987_61378 [Smallanthus sonchifolius]|uniref:Uncharacterized protein n=1 Tax=Smallanthus sonchifolius TaxID=185202 RepID=A0ACB9C7I5_9ASTR|nr:hypothetical protein L1987_61378 [Smallanthus sonchifolius]
MLGLLSAGPPFCWACAKGLLPFKIYWAIPEFFGLRFWASSLCGPAAMDLVFWACCHASWTAPVLGFFPGVDGKFWDTDEGSEDGASGDERADNKIGMTRRSGSRKGKAKPSHNLDGTMESALRREESRHVDVICKIIEESVSLRLKGRYNIKEGAGKEYGNGEHIHNGGHYPMVSRMSLLIMLRVFCMEVWEGDENDIGVNGVIGKGRWKYTCWGVSRDMLLGCNHLKLCILRILLVVKFSPPNYDIECMDSGGIGVDQLCFLWQGLGRVGTLYTTKHHSKNERYKGWKLLLESRHCHCMASEICMQCPSWDVGWGLGYFVGLGWGDILWQDIMTTSVSSSLMLTWRFGEQKGWEWR